MIIDRLFFKQWCVLLCFMAIQLLVVLPAEASYKSKYVKNERVAFLGDGGGQYLLNAYTSYLEDINSELTLQDVTSKAFSKKFIENKKRVINPGYTSSTYWVKVEVEYNSYIQRKHEKKIARKWLLELGHPQFEIAEMFTFQKDGSYKLQTSDIRTPLKDREVRHVNSVFPIETFHGKRLTLYFKLKTSSSFIIPLTLWSADDFIKKVAVEEFANGLFYGCMLVMLLYNFFVYLTVRDVSYLYYVMYIFGISVFQLLVKSHGVLVFGDEADLINKLHMPGINAFVWFCIFQLTRSFLNTAVEHPKIDRMLKITLYFTIISGVLSYLIDYPVATKWMVKSAMTFMVMVPAVALYCWIKGNTSARFFFLAWLTVQMSFLIYAGMALGVLPANALTISSTYIGIVLEVTLLSFALAERIKAIQKEAIDANEKSMQHLQHYRSVFNNAIEGLYQISLADRFINVNPALVKLLGYDSKSAMTNNSVIAMNTCFSDDDIRAQVIKGLHENGFIQNVEAQYQRQNGSFHWASHSARVIMGKNGGVSHLEGHFVDITEKKEKEQAHLERESAREKEEIAKASAEAKSSFLANMSHEIRTPLTAIIGYSESLRDAQLNKEEARNSIDIVVRSSHHLLNLINDILDFSKIEANTLEVECIDVDLMLLLSEIQSYFGMNAHQKGLEFTINLNYPLPRHIHADPTRLKQVLLNLCSNALKFTKEGSVCIDVKYLETDQKMVFQVTDTGIGLNEKQIEGLFEAFTQADSSTTRNYGGTGLGLNISKQLAELMGGDIQVKSTPGIGSQFVVSIASGALEKVDWITNESDAQLIPMGDANTLVIPQLKGHVLYAEDSMDNQRLVALLLKKTGATLTLVENGQEAIDAIKEHEIDVILMDIQMPIMNGIDATQAIRKLGFDKPIVAFTANVMKEEVALYKEIGCDLCLGKPVDRALFYRTLQGFIGTGESVTQEPMYHLSAQNADSESAVNSVPQVTGRILLAEDNVDNQRLISMHIKRTGADIIIANNGEEAVEQAMQEEFDVVFMDINMPVMNGIDATEMLRMTGYSKPIYALTASNDQEDVDKCIAAGCQGYLTKPLEIDKFHEVIVNELSLKAAEGVSNDQSADVTHQDPEMQELIACFCEGLPSYVTKIKEAHIKEDWQILQDLAHQLKGSAGSFGFPELTLKAKFVEVALKAHRFEQVETLCSDLLNELTEILLDNK
ncbi:MAG: PAS domain S-box-containing protein [Oleiphilaceae bacterium]|jgi:PAS domain S-box-containing protein